MRRFETATPFCLGSDAAHVDISEKRRLMAQLAADCALLEELRVMDYSLLLGVHSRSAEGYTSAELITDRVRRPGPTPAWASSRQSAWQTLTQQVRRSAH